MAAAALSIAEAQDEPRARGSQVIGQTPGQAAKGGMSAEQAIQNWKNGPKEAAQQLLTKYGQPQEVTQQRLIWHQKGPFAKIELVDEELNHDFPMPHKDYLGHTVNYVVPADRADELAKFDGSILFDRTKGTLTARCDTEKNNLIGLNLAHDVATGKKSADEARTFFAEIAKQKKHQEYTQSLLFQPATAAAGFTDQPVDPAGTPVREKEPQGGFQQP